MKQILRLHNTIFDPFSERVILEKPTHLEDLGELTFEAFRHSNLISCTLPIEVIDTKDKVYYIFSWEIIGELDTVRRLDKDFVLLYR